jgi:phosphoribosyl 1,2-cyclic phosphate phosphodiesterase
MKQITRNYSYLFNGNFLVDRAVGFYEKIKIGNFDVQLFRQNHGTIDSLGIRIGNFVYSNDVMNFPTKSEQFLQNIDIWILDCIDFKSTIAHAGLDKILQWNELYKPRQILLTNMNHNIDYYEISKILPKNIIPLYDGAIFNIETL